MGKESKASSLKSEQKAIVLRSVAQYLERCGFSKCFKKLLSEAEIEKKELKSSLPDVEKVFCEFFNKSHAEAVEVKDGGDDEDVEKEAGSVDDNAADDQETDKEDKKKEVTEVSAMEGVEKVKKEKKKKKKKKEPKVEVTKEEEKAVTVDENATDDHETDQEDKKKEVPEVSAMEGVEKEKKKKKNKEPKVEVTKEEEEKVVEEAELEDGVKEKKKKKTKSKSTEGEPLVVDDDDKEKVSKKRKRSDPEETKEQTEEEDDEESKRRKKEENVVEETPVKQADVEKSATKSAKGLSNSKEPKKPFQRVKVDEIVFTDDRLKDNSYWAKDGADSGYGAKAQEVLGQVRGRGFRHEKTKKKRGSYRGGEIDLQSHSVKFEYSDEE